MPDAAAIQSPLEPLLPGLMGIRLTETTPERVSATMRVRPDLCTTGGILHGGAVMAFADTLGAVGTFVNLPPGARTTTVESSTKFLAGAPVETTVSAQCTPFQRGAYHDGLADPDPHRSRQAPCGGHADPTRHPGSLGRPAGAGSPRRAGMG